MSESTGSGPTLAVNIIKRLTETTNPYATFTDKPVVDVCGTDLIQV